MHTRHSVTLCVTIWCMYIIQYYISQRIVHHSPLYTMLYITHYMILYWVSIQCTHCRPYSPVHHDTALYFFLHIILTYDTLGQRYRAVPCYPHHAVSLLSGMSLRLLKRYILQSFTFTEELSTCSP